MSQVLICTGQSSLQKRLASAADRAGLTTYTATKADAALRLMTEHQPAIVLLDQDFETSREVAVNLLGIHPKARVILLVREPSFDLSRTALRAGIADLVLFPSELERLDQLLPRINHTEGRSVAFFSVRGGAGCTTLAINTAVACTSLAAGPVLLIDGNMQTADISGLLDVKHPRSIADLLPVIDELTAGHIRDVCATHESGLHVLLAPPDPTTAELLTPDHLARIARVGKRGFAAVIIDCPSPLDDRCAAILGEVATPVLVATPEAPSIIAWRRLKHLVPANSKIVPSQISTRSEIAQADMARLTGLEGFPSVRHDSATVVPLINLGRTLFDVTKQRKLPAVTQDVIRLARRLMGVNT